MAAIMTTTLLQPIKPSTASTHPHLDILEEDHQRGRKRRRSSANLPTPHLPSTGIRGRGRRRSLSHSQDHTQSQPHSYSPSSSLTKTEQNLTSTTSTSLQDRKSPGRKYQKKQQQPQQIHLGADSKHSHAQYLDVMMHHYRSNNPKKRSQSPSRSRSLGHEGDSKPRRRQRTHSRSRSHGKENARRGYRESFGAGNDNGVSDTGNSRKGIVRERENRELMDVGKEGEHEEESDIAVEDWIFLSATW